MPAERKTPGVFHRNERGRGGAEFKLYPPEQQDQRIVIQGGLPQLPGCENLIMPQLDGKPTTNGHALAAPADAVPAIESPHKAQGPSPQEPEP